MIYILVHSPKNFFSLLCVCVGAIMGAMLEMIEYQKAVGSGKSPTCFEWFLDRLTTM